MKKKMNKKTKIIIGVFAVVGVALAVLAFFNFRDFFSTFNLENGGGGPNVENLLPEIVNDGDTEPADDAQAATPTAMPTQADIGGSQVDLAKWDGSSRVNILVMGIDYNDWRAGQGAPRTDTMILFSIDPQTMTASMLSIPRDLWVEVPGFGFAKINAAYQYGEDNRLPGGGPALAVKTVEKFLGLDVHYYAKIDFQAFIEFVDLIGGVKLDVTEPVKIDIESTDSPFTIEPGRYTLNGEYALGYVRSRATGDGDTGRSQRQQQVVLAMLRQVLRPFNLTKLTTNAFDIYNQLSYGVETNMTFDQIFKMGMLVLDLREADIKGGVIQPPNQVIFATHPVFGDILKPITAEIRALRDDLFGSATPTAETILGKSAQELMLQEGATVSILNGSSTSGLAVATTEFLQPYGVNVVETGTFENLESISKLYLYSDKIYTAEFLMQALEIPENRVLFMVGEPSNADIVVVLGNQWAVPGQ